MCTLINGATRVRRACLEPAPDAESTAQGMPWRTRCAALAAFQAGALRAFAVPRLALPAEAARLVGGRGGLLRQGVRDDTGRAVGRHLPPAQGPLGVCGTACDREALAGGHGLGVPGARLDTPRRLVPPGGIALAMGRERPGGYGREGRQEHQAGFGGFPWVPQAQPARARAAERPPWAASRVQERAGVCPRLRERRDGSRCASTGPCRAGHPRPGPHRGR